MVTPWPQLALRQRKGFRTKGLRRRVPDCKSATVGSTPTGASL